MRCPTFSKKKKTEKSFSKERAGERLFSKWEGLGYEKAFHREQALFWLPKGCGNAVTMPWLSYEETYIATMQNTPYLAERHPSWEDEIEGWMDEILSEDKPRKTKCECGGEKAGTGHSTWCPVYREF